MGRPINKRFIGNEQGAIKVSSYRRVGETETTGEDDTYILRQRTNNRFTVADESGGWEENLRLVDKTEGTLNEGEFIIEAVDNRGNPSRVTKLYNRSVILSGNEQEIWAPQPDITLGIESVVLDGVTDVTINTVENHPFSTGDNVRFHNVGGTTQLNYSYFVKVESDTVFKLVNTVGAGYTTYSSGGTVQRIDSDNTVSISGISLPSTTNIEVTTSSAHGLKSGEEVIFKDIVGPVDLNAQEYTITKTSDTQFTLDSTNPVNFNDYVSNEGEMTREAKSFGILDIELVVGQPVRIVTASDHTFISGERVDISGIQGTVELNDKSYLVLVTSSDSFIIPEAIFNGHNFSAYVSGGGVASRDAETALIGDIDAESDTDSVSILTQADASFQTGDVVTISNLPTVQELNGTFTVNRLGARTFQLFGTVFGNLSEDYQKKPGELTLPQEDTTIVHMDIEGNSGNVRLFLLEDSTAQTGTEIFVFNSDIVAGDGSFDVTNRIDARTFEFNASKSTYSGTYESRGGTKGFIIPARDGHEQRIVQMRFDGTSDVEIRTLYDHGLQDGNYVYIKDLESATELNNKLYKVSRINPEWFSLDDTDSSQVSFFEGAGQVYTEDTTLTIDNISISATGVITVNLSSSSNSFRTGDIVSLTGDGPDELDEDYSTTIDRRYYRIKRISGTQFELVGVMGHSNDFGVTVDDGNADLFTLRSYIKDIYVSNNDVYYDLVSATDISTGQFLIVSIVDMPLGGTSSHFATDNDLVNDGNFIIYDLGNSYTAVERTTADNYGGNTDKAVLFNRYTRISSITKEDSADIEVSYYSPSGFSFETGDEVEFVDVEGASELNDSSYTVTRVDSNTITLDSTDSTSISEFKAESLRKQDSTGATINDFQRNGNAATTDVSIEFPNPHGFSAGDQLVLDNVGIVFDNSFISGDTFIDQPLVFTVESVENDRNLTLKDTTDDGTANAEFDYDSYRPYGRIIRQGVQTSVSGVTLTDASPVSVSVTNTTAAAYFLTGDTVSFVNVGGTTELNGNSYTITAVSFDADTDTEVFTLDGTSYDATTPNFSAWTANGSATRDGHLRDVTAKSWNAATGYTFTIASGHYPAGVPVYFNSFLDGGGGNSIAQINGSNTASFTVTSSTSTSVTISASQWSSYTTPFDALADQRGQVFGFGDAELIRHIDVVYNTNHRIEMEEDTTITSTDRVLVQGLREPDILNGNVYAVESVSGRTVELADTATTDRVNRYQKPQNFMATELEKNYIADTNNEERFMNPTATDNLSIQTVFQHLISANEEFLLDGMEEESEDVEGVKNTAQTAHSADLSLSSSVSQRATRFRTGSNPNGYTLDEVDIVIGSSTPSAASDMSVRIDSGTIPNATEIAHLTTPSDVTTSGTKTFTAPSGVTLQPDTEYYVRVVRHNDGFNIGRTTSNNEDSSSSPGWSIANESRVLTSSGWNNNPSNPFRMALRMEPNPRLGADLNQTIQTVASETDNYKFTVAGQTLGNLSPFVGHEAEMSRSSQNYEFNNFALNSNPNIGPLITTDGIHNIQTDDIITIDEVGGTTELNGNSYRAQRLSSTQILLPDIDSGDLSAYAPTGSITRASVDVSVQNVVKDGSNVLKIVTPLPHGFVTGEDITFSGVEGTTELNGNTYTITKVNDTEFTLDGTDSSNFTDFQTSGDAEIDGVNLDIKDIFLNSTDPVVIKTADNHMLQDNQSVLIENVGGTTELNDNTYSIRVINNNSFYLFGTNSAEFSQYLQRGRVTKLGTDGATAQLSFQQS